MFKLIVLLAIVVLPGTQSWDNGLARKPPMGWLSWERFACVIDCETYPKDCIHEQLYKDMIDRIVNDGYLQLGYKFVNIDDCWMEHQRDANTSRLVPDKKRFPSGIKALADYAHSKGTLLGIYEDVGTKTCAGYPGTQSDNKDHSDIDAETFSEWGVDAVKLDGCYENEKQFSHLYPEYRNALEKVSKKHKIMYSCEWPLYMKEVKESDYSKIRDTCNYWRNHGDIVDTFNSIQNIINFFGDNGHIFAKFHGPGGWFDPDMLVIGNDGLSYEQSKTQMAFWCLWSAPLLMSNDLRTIKQEHKEILQNKHLISVNQDPLGKMGVRIGAGNNRQAWVKQVSPENGHKAYVVLYYNREPLGPPVYISHELSNLIPELNSTLSYNVYDLFDDYAHIDTLKSNQHLTLLVRTSGSVRIVKLVAKK